MKKFLLLLPLMFLSSVKSQSSEIVEPIEFCYSSAECSLFLFHNNTGEFVVDADEAFAAVKDINTKDFNFGIARITAEEKSRQTAIARETKRVLYCMNRELASLQKQGMKAVDGVDKCSWNIATCTTVSAALAYGKESSKVLLALGLVGLRAD